MFVGASFTTLFVFAAFVGSGNILNAENAFVILALINSARFPLNMLPLGVKAVAEARVASKRIQRFLDRPELPPRQAYSPLSGLPGSAPVIGILFFVIGIL
jgi:ABC-type multidrug transport system fused ATPase/permease subunit